jgi:hypothetical protein
MKLLTSTLFAFLFTITISLPSYANWTKVVEVQGNVFYVNFEIIKKTDGYVYFWQLVDLSKPTQKGVLSDKGYLQGNCKLLQFKSLNFSSYKEPMGRGTPSESSNDPDKEWTETPPDTVSEPILKSVCSR